MQCIQMHFFSKKLIHKFLENNQILNGTYNLDIFVVVYIPPCTPEFNIAWTQLFKIFQLLTQMHILEFDAVNSVFEYYTI